MSDISSYTPPDDATGGLDPSAEASLRDFMADVDASAGRARGAVDEVLTSFPSRQLSADLRDTFTELTRTIAAADGAGERAAIDAFRTMMDDRITRQARDRIVAENLDRTHADVDGYAREAEALLEVLEAQVITEAVGQPDRRREQLARDEVSQLLDRSDDKIAAAVAIASDPDPDLRAVIAGPWGRRFLTALGLPPEVYTDRVRPAAITAAATHGRTEQARAAGEAWPHLGQLRGVVQSTGTLGRMRTRPFTARARR